MSIRPAGPVALVCKGPACGMPLYGVVQFCPYCGAQMAIESPVATVPARAPTKSGRRPALPSEIPPLLDLPQGEPVPAPARAATPPIEPPATPPQRRAPAPAGDAGPSPARENGGPVNQGPKKRWGRYIAALVVVVLGWQMLKPATPDGCVPLLTTSATEADKGALQSAKARALEAVSICKGDEQQTARVAFAELEKKIAIAQVCDQAVTEFSTSMSDGRLAPAMRALETQVKSCGASAAIESRRQAVAEAQSKAVDLISQARRHSENGQFDQARSMLAAAEKIDRGNGEISVVRASVDAEERSVAAAAAVTKAQAAAAPPAVAAPAPAPSATPSVNAANTAAEEMTAAMLRDGELALAQKRFSDAKALASSVMRVVPSGQARDLFKRAVDAEARVLRDETVLK